MLITQNIFLSPSELEDYMGNLIKKCIKFCYNHCSFKYGFITRFYKITKINYNKIDFNGINIIFNVTMEIDNFLPKINEIYEFPIIIKKYNDGIFLQLYGKMDIFVPTDGLPDSNQHLLKNNRVNQIKIIHLRWNHTQYDAIGAIIN